MDSRWLAACGTRPAIVVAVFLFASATAGCGHSDPLPPENPDKLTIRLRSSAFADGAAIPSAFTCDGSDHSPPLEWSGVPDSAQTLVLICDDPDAPGRTWSHWVVFNLPAEIRALKAIIPPDQTITATSMEGLSLPGGDGDARQGKNDFGNPGYGGPCPPSGVHRYFFRLYALDAKLDLGALATRADVLIAIKGRVLAEGRLMGKYQRSAKE
jgi:Raf kinase inhibitor-like YbhB/YbcL family protein